MSYILWAGTDSGFEEYVAILNRFSSISPKDYTEQGALVSTSSRQEERLPRLLSIHGETAIVAIQGILTDRESWFNRYAGLIAYSEIRDAIVTAVATEGVKEILAYVKSPGGVVSGLHDTYEFIKKAAKLKTITMYSDSMVASAAMWISAPMKHKMISADATAGSIGVVVMHIEYSKQMKEAGVTATVIRAGEFKQLANSVEPLSDKAKKDFQAKADHTYGVFVQAIADSYGTTYQAANKMAEGREFIGSQAVDVGLIDAISNFDSVLETIQSRIKRKTKTGGFGMKKSYAITAANLAALAAGADVGDMDLKELPEGVTFETKADAEAALEAADTDDVKQVAQTAIDAFVKEEAIEAKATALSEAEAALEAAETDDEKVKAQAALDALKAEGGTEDGDGETGDGDTGEANPTGEGAPAAEASSVVLLKEQLKAKDDELFQAKVDLKAATEKVEGFEATETSFKAIAVSVINNMQVALGGSAVDLKETDSKALLNTYDSTLKVFSEQFKVGGVASVDAGAEEEPANHPKVTRLHQAGLNAVKTAGTGQE